MSTSLVFVSSVTTGGSPRSQRELAAALVGRGHVVTFVVDDERRAPIRRWLLEQGEDAVARFENQRIASIAARLRGLIGRRARTVEDQFSTAHSIAPENIVSRLVGGTRPAPDAIVASSVDRYTWRSIRELCTAEGIRSALYLREEAALRHLEAGLFPDLLLANSRTLVEGAAAYGCDAILVPSIIDPVVIDPPPTGQVALLVNPVESHGVDVVAPLATSRPDIPIVLQESWSLTSEQQARLDDLASAHPSVEIRPFTDRPDQLFRDARVLLTPHRVDNRPRIVVEAQANGIPTVAFAQPGLVEVVGDGGVLVAPASDADEFVSAVATLWDDNEEFRRCREAALAFASREEIRPDVIVDRFIDAVLG